MVRKKVIVYRVILDRRLEQARVAGAQSMLNVAAQGNTKIVFFSDAGSVMAIHPSSRCPTSLRNPRR